MEIPYSELPPHTLINIVEEFVSREGTDYGDHSYNLTDKVEQVIEQLKTGKARVVFDSETDSIHIEAVIT